jgi:dTDP-glucose pyrophosphorylase
MKDWRKTVIRLPASMADAIAAIDRGALQICLVTDHDGMLMGTVTDGDVRRAILGGLPLDAPAERVMRTQPLAARDTDPRHRWLEQMQVRDVRQLPLVDAAGRVVGLALRDEMLGAGPDRDNVVVLMVGGLGSRLMPLTQHTPKPLLKVGSRPILETIVEGFVAQGFRNFYFTVNYKAEMIRAHFGDGSAFGARITYVEEPDRLGTAGALALLPDRPSAPLIVMNGDLLTRVDFAGLLDFHREHAAEATMCVREFDFQVPYGVVRTEAERILSIEEKPVHSFLVNAGIYVLDPAVLTEIPAGGAYDMPQLFSAIAARNGRACVFPIREYWVDIGHIDDLRRADGEFHQVFN